MPELPEVVTVVKLLEPDLINKTIKKFEIYYAKLLWRNEIEDFKKRVENQKILKIFNQGKYIIFELENDVLISHLRMEGRWNFEPQNTLSYKESWLECQFILDDGFVLRYYDSRKFGTLEIVSKESFFNGSALAHLGPSILDPNLTAKQLFEKFQKIKRPIKSVLLEQNIISGIGNIYDNEILFATKINPLTPANEITLKTVSKLLTNAIEILKTSISVGGTTIHSFTPKQGVSGGYQDFLKVHGREKKECYLCQTPIAKIKVNGRGTYYCPKCQK
ncbi:formamidopyrimidine-DNA glycosylase [Williamsoniiplasma luminosum]|uniref:Formamidopyrimidine-DNA glycosylase n=1 Tax=Williamsoniiplasma luminosum TaxID=214888 RepID=A0A2K8NT94_9MOLU|nr:DNA-formamidopyrimidine glycosylase [Williamsoniiplasma luminosum]ATZ17062.1 formamidopyrimidine-DNA glycosylase [Williamsoniiplasma luminosum]